MSIKYPSLLAFEGKISCSDALLFSTKKVNLDELTPIKIGTKDVRGTISNRQKKANIAQIDAKLENPNLQRIDFACLEVDDDTLVAKYTVKILAFNAKPCSCNSKEFQDKLEEKIQKFIVKNSMMDLAHRYATNIVNARSLFRNRASADSVEVIVRFDNKELVFNALDFDLNSFDYINDNLKILTQEIEKGFLGKKLVLLDIEVRLFLGRSQTVYPSEEMCLDKSQKTAKSKVLFSRNGQAAIHSQKIGNGIRTIDNYYKLDEQYQNNYDAPIAVDPYGCVTTYAIALRKSGNSFYDILENLVVKDEDISKEQMLFLIAVLIRGGVFGANDKE